jgi:hypothetical protein
LQQYVKKKTQIGAHLADVSWRSLERQYCGLGGGRWDVVGAYQTARDAPHAVHPQLLRERKRGCEMTERQDGGGTDRRSPMDEHSGSTSFSGGGDGICARLSLSAVILHQELKCTPPTKLVYLAVEDAAEVDQDLDARRGDDEEEKTSSSGG